jgi:tellurite resistance protein TerC
VLALVVADLGLFHRRPHTIGFRESALWTAAWASLSLLFCFGLYRYTLSAFGAIAAQKIALEFLTGYVVEWSLSFDNMFVFVLVFDYFKIPPRLQHGVLFWGIVGALILRGIFIAAGAALLAYGWVVVLFGIFLILTGAKMTLSSDRQVRPEGTLLMRGLRKIVPMTPRFEGQRFFLREGGRWRATPLLAALVFVEASDILFAIDSVPAIFAITREPMIVFTSNVFAILGLRAVYFLLAGAVDRFHLLRYGLALILMFVGVKMTVPAVWGVHFPTGISLAVIVAVMAATIGLSLKFPKAAARL